METRFTSDDDGWITKSKNGISASGTLMSCAGNFIATAHEI
jgi:hypothetical protein